MALDFSVHGSMLVSVDTTPPALPTPTYVPLGRTPADALPNFTPETLSIPILTSEFGDTPADRIYSGQVIRITLSLIEFDRAILNEMTTNPSTEVSPVVGHLGTPGLLMHGEGRTGSNSFGLQFSGALSGTAQVPTYQFPNCAIDGNVEYTQIGIETEIVTIPILALPYRALDDDPIDTAPIYIEVST